MRTETEKLIETCDFISMDTSALMETNALQNFVEKYGPALIKAGRMVFIYKEVLAELKVLSHIDKPVKAYQATLALQILRNNQCLFRLEVSIDEVNVKCRRIADQRIIGAVTWYIIRSYSLVMMSLFFRQSLPQDKWMQFTENPSMPPGWRTMEI